MSGFLYFVPDYKCPPAGPDEAALRRCGLEHLRGAVFSHNAIELGRGPGGNSGTTLVLDDVAPGGSAPVCGYYPEKQTWRQFKLFWLGCETARPPRPADLVRKEILPGHLVTMGDGNPWRVPAERFLPNRLELDEDGHVQRVPLPQFAALKQQTRLLWDDYLQVISAAGTPADGPPAEKKALRLTDAEQFRLAAHYLGVNYRLAVPECNLLGLLSEACLVRVLEAILDVPALAKMMEAEAKKKAGGG